MIEKKQIVNVIGSGFSGIECSLFLASHGIKVHLFDDGKEYKPEEVKKYIECNFSQKRKIFEEILLKELELLGSPLVRYKIESKQKFDTDYCQQLIKVGKDMIRNHENIQIFTTSVHQINPNEITVIASGNNTDERLIDFLIYYFGHMNCFKKIAVFPKFKNVDLSKLYKVDDGENRYYLPLNREEYNKFINKIKYFVDKEMQNNRFSFIENTMEWLVDKGEEDLRNYAMIPIYISSLSEKPYAVLKFKETDKGLRLDEIGSKFSEEEQEIIFKSLKGFENAKLVKKADVINSCLLNSKFIINEFNQAVINNNIFFAGSILGIEGAIDSIATGLATAININKYFNDYQMQPLPKETCIGTIERKMISSKEIKPQVFLDDYGFLSNEEDLTKEDIVERYFQRSVMNLEKFKERYKNGKHV